jgi:hypothetical protein
MASKIYVMLNYDQPLTPNHSRTIFIYNPNKQLNSQVTIYHALVLTFLKGRIHHQEWDTTPLQRTAASTALALNQQILLWLIYIQGQFVLKCNSY